MVRVMTLLRRRVRDIAQRAAGGIHIEAVPLQMSLVVLNGDEHLPVAASERR